MPTYRQVPEFSHLDVTPSWHDGNAFYDLDGSRVLRSIAAKCYGRPPGFGWFRNSILLRCFVLGRQLEDLAFEAIESRTCGVHGCSSCGARLSRMGQGFHGDQADFM